MIVALTITGCLLGVIVFAALGWWLISSYVDERW